MLDTLGYLATLFFFIWSNSECRIKELTMEDELDAILAQYSSDLTDFLEPANPAFSSFDPVHGSSTSTQAPPPQFPPVQTPSIHSSSRFAPLKTDSEVEQAKASAVPLNTRKGCEHLERLESTQMSSNPIKH